MKSRFLLLNLLLACCVTCCGLPEVTANAASARQPTQAPGRAIDEEEDEPPVRRERKTPPKLTVPAYVTYWTHDALGYHPSIMLTIENVSDVSLLGEPIQLQAHFRLLSEGILTVYRWHTRLDSIGSKQQVNTEAHGKRPFELPIDPGEWPMIECKVICKIGDVSSEESQNLIVARIQPVAMTDEDARTQLNSQLGNNRLAKAKMEQGKKKFEAEHPRPRPLTERTERNDRTERGSLPKSGNYNSSSRYVNHANNPPVAPPTPPPVAEKPLIAVANSLSQNPSTRFGANNSATSSNGPGSNSRTVTTSTTSGIPSNSSGSGNQYVLKSNLPGLGDDFYQFEKIMGMPLQTDVKDKNWIWASYKKHPAVKIVAGSKGRTGKADVVVCAINQDNSATLNDVQFVSLAKALAGKFKNEKSSAAEHSVRYTDDGRIELINLTTQSCRAVYFKTTDASGQNQAVIAISRLPGSVSELLKEEGHKSDLLRFTLKGLGEGEKAEE